MKRYVISQKERKCNVFLEQGKKGYFTLKEAATQIQLSYRHAK